MDPGRGGKQGTNCDKPHRQHQGHPRAGQQQTLVTRRLKTSQQKEPTEWVAVRSEREDDSRAPNMPFVLFIRAAVCTPDAQAMPIVAGRHTRKQDSGLCKQTTRKQSSYRTSTSSMSKLFNGKESTTPKSSQKQKQPQPRCKRSCHKQGQTAVTSERVTVQQYSLHKADPVHRYEPDQNRRKQADYRR